MSKHLKSLKEEREDLLALSFISSLSKDNNSKKEKVVRLDSNSKEIAEIISNKLLQTIEKKLILK